MAKTQQPAITTTWHPGRLLEGYPVWQAYVFALTPDRKLVLVRDSDEERFTLPGGRIESNETAEQGALRELQEEAQIKSAKTVLLGVVEVEDRSQTDIIQAHHQQARYVCHIKELGEFIPNKDGFEVAERITIDPSRLPEYIHWMNKPNGQAQYQTFLTYIQGLAY